MKPFIESGRNFVFLFIEVVTDENRGGLWWTEAFPQLRVSHRQVTSQTFTELIQRIQNWSWFGVSWSWFWPGFFSCELTVDLLLYYFTILNPEVSKQEKVMVSFQETSLDVWWCLIKFMWCPCFSHISVFFLFCLHNSASMFPAAFRLWSMLWKSVHVVHWWTQFTGFDQ